MKYGIKVPRNLQDAITFDEENGNTFWKDAIDLEMNTILPGFDFPEDGKPPPGYTKSSGHLVFDVKLGENFRRKARYVADGHKTRIPSSVTYSTVVARDSVRICLTIAALNDLDILSADIENAYLTA